MRFLPSLSQDQLTELAKLTGGAATLVVVALFISGASSFLKLGSGLAAAVVCNAGTCEQQTTGGYTLTLDVGSATVESGESATINWDVTPTPTPISFDFGAFGNGITANNTQQTISGNSALGSFPYADLTSFKIGSDIFVSVLRSAGWALYRFIPTGGTGGLGCLGNMSSSCGSTVGSVAITTALSQKVFTIGSDTYIAIGDAASTATTRVYKWMPGSNCFGNGSSCWSVLQQFNARGQSLDFFSITSGAETGDYLVVGNRTNNDVRIYKWNSTSNCFHTGTACASGSTYPGYKSVTGLSSNLTAVKAFYRIDPTTSAAELFLAVGFQNNSAANDLKFYKWIESGPSGAPCFGKNSSSACSTVYAPDSFWTSAPYNFTQSVANINSIDYVYGRLVVGTNGGGFRHFSEAVLNGSGYVQYVPNAGNPLGDINVRGRLATDGHETYLLTGAYSNMTNSAKMHKWSPTLNCFGSGATMCGGGFVEVTIPSGGSRPTYAMTAFPYNGTWFLANIYNDGNISFYRAMPPAPCLGNNSGCNNVIKDPQGNSALGGFTHHTFDWEPFKIGSTWYIARAAQSGYWYPDTAGNHIDYVNTPEHSMIYKWYPAYERFGDKVYVNSGSNTCYDGTTNCIDDDGEYGYGRAIFHAFQDIFSNKAYDWLAFTMGSDTYLMLATDPLAGTGMVGSQLYKWGTQASKGTAGGLRGEYFNNEYFYGSSISRTEGPIDFDYGSGKPAGVDSVITTNNNFSIRWTGTIVAPVAGTYTFTLDADDGARLWLDDIMVIDNWNSAGGGSYTVANVQPGQNISVRLEYREVTGNARARLYWSYSGQPTQIIPASNLYPNQVSTDGCLGNGKASGTTCGSPFQTLAVSASDSTFFTTASGSYLLLAGSDGRLFKWYPTINDGGTAGCFSGDGSTCGSWASALQTINASNPWALATTTISGNTYVAMGLAGTSNGIRLYRWRTSGGSGSTLCPSTGLFGNTSNCDTSTAYQTLSPGTVKELQFFVPAGETTTYLAAASNNDNRVYIYKWITGGSAPCNTTVGGGFGAGSTCGSAQQSINLNFDPNTLKVFTINSTTYLIIKSSNDQETARVMKWQTTGGGCFGDGTTCGNTLFSTTLPSDNEDTNAFLLFTPDNSTYYLGFGGEGSDPNNGPNWFDSTYLYKWLEGSSQTSLPISSCSVTWSNASGSGSLGSADSAGPIMTEPLTEDTTYTLSCEDLPGSVSKTVTVTEPVTSFPQPLVSIVPAADATLVEGASPTDTASFTVSYTGTASTSPIVVSYTVSGTATADTDYTALSGSVTIPANQTSAPITVSSPSDKNDTIHEGDETVIVTLNDSGGASEGNYDLGTPTNASVTITDTETDTTLPSNGGNAFTVCTGTASASCTLGVTPGSVRRGNTVTVTWYVTGLITGSDVSHPGNTCTVSASPSLSGFPKTSSAGDTQWVNTGNTVKPTILQRTTFTFSCSAPNGTTKTTPVTKTINILPGFQEI